MQKDISLKLTPSEAVDDTIITSYLAQSMGIKESDILGFHRMTQSIDARSRKQVWIHLSLKAFINEPFYKRKITPILCTDVSHAKTKVIIVGAGPAGLFAAIKLMEAGIQPIIIERGKEVRARRRDLAILNKEGIVNPESNYCFGEGGAGTYSDGKLYTRSSKRGDITRILNLLFQFGADEKILYEAHPHIGTNKLPDIITAIRLHIINYGGIFLFEKKMVDFNIQNNIIKAITTADGDTIVADAIILATGHSARDIFHLLHKKKIRIEAKPFAMGVRIEHPQTLIDSIQYHCLLRDGHLPPAAYGLVEQVNERGVFSFCMCPGGIIAPASTNNGELVVNGWSPSKRNNAFANSGMVVQVEEKETLDFLVKKNSSLQYNPLLFMHLQETVEQTAFIAGGGKQQAPAQRMVDFSTNKISANLPSCSYLPGITAADLGKVLPDFIFERLQKGFMAFGKKMHGYYTNEAVVVATESRTSSPVRIPRDNIQLHHPEINNLYPCGEGAGYAGGIVSAAMDGERVASMIIKKER